MEDDARDAQCATNIRAFDDFRVWSNAVKVILTGLYNFSNWRNQT